MSIHDLIRQAIIKKAVVRAPKVAVSARTRSKGKSYPLSVLPVWRVQREGFGTRWLQPQLALYPSR